MSTSTPHLAVLGLGIIGSRASGRLIDAGYTVTRWNRSPKGLPGEAATPADAVRNASVVLLFLKDATAVRSVCSGILPVLAPGSTVVNHSTIDLDTTLWLDSSCRNAGIRFLDCPFTGSRDAAAAGNLVFYQSGPGDLAAEIRPILLQIGKEIIPCGEIGAATIIKLATNLVSACTVQALAEAFAIVTRHGVDAASFLNAMARNANASPLAAMKLPAIASNDFTTHFSLDNMRKDSVYAIDLARAKHLETPAINAVSRRMTELCAQGQAQLDFSSLAKPYADTRTA